MGVLPETSDGRKLGQISKTIAVGAIHGCSIALAALVEVVDPQSDDTIIPLGELVDRGIDSKGVIDQLIALGGRCNLVPSLRHAGLADA